LLPIGDIRATLARLPIDPGRIARSAARRAELSTSLARYIRAFVAMMIGLTLGFIASAWSLGSGHGFGALHVGPWTAWPQTGGAEIDPYARAALARSGEAPLGRDQGLAFLATADSSGAPLDGRCDYRILSPVPAARFWTLSLLTPGGYPPPNPIGRHVFTSSEILRREGGGFEIVIARDAKSGNWLSPGDAGRFTLMLRLYETPLDLDAAHPASTFPQIIRQTCS